MHYLANPRRHQDVYRRLGQPFSFAVYHGATLRHYAALPKVHRKSRLLACIQSGLVLCRCNSLSESSMSTATITTDVIQSSLKSTRVHSTAYPTSTFVHVR